MCGWPDGRLFPNHCRFGRVVKPLGHYAPAGRCPPAAAGNASCRKRLQGPRRQEEQCRLKDNIASCRKACGLGGKGTKKKERDAHVQSGYDGRGIRRVPLEVVRDGLACGKEEG